MTATQLREHGFQVEFHSHSEAILAHDFIGAWDEISNCLLDLEIPIEELIGSGGGEAKGTQRLRRSLAEEGWGKMNFEIQKSINGVPKTSISHEVDHVKQFDGQGVIALEIEWNNKDPFFDRDLENFKRLHAEGAISMGMIITRGSALQNGLPTLVSRFFDEQNIRSFEDLEVFGYTPTTRQRSSIMNLVGRNNNPLSFKDAFVRKFVSDKYGQATTHWAKLEDRLARGVGNPCPLVFIGLPESIVSFGDKPSVNYS